VCSSDLDDALRMLDESLAKREIKILRNYAEVGTIRFEKAKLLQIFMNVIKNAYEAMDAAAAHEAPVPTLAVVTEWVDGPPPYALVKVKDTGIGFPPGDRERLFQFGYTTKERGSGFGLHSCANYLIANGGAITAASSGIGTGAEVVIKLAGVYSKLPPADSAA